MARKKVRSAGHPRQRAKFVNRRAKLSVRRQCELLGICRSMVYYKPVGIDDQTRDIMRKIDELHLEEPAAGSRLLRDYLSRDKIPMSRGRVRRLSR